MHEERGHALPGLNLNVPDERLPKPVDGKTAQKLAAHIAAIEVQAVPPPRDPASDHEIVQGRCELSRHLLHASILQACCKLAACP